VPVPLLNDGVNGAEIVNVAEATALRPLTGEPAIALMVVVLLSLIGPENAVDAVVGVLPSVV
jgi:hypothetical protein